MSEYSKPLPDTADPATAPFWEATRAGSLVTQVCPSCSYRRWPPGPVCPECQTQGGVWTETQPRGTLWSFAVYHRAFDPAFADDLPYTVGLIELDDGPRMYGMMRGQSESFVAGARVHAVFEAVTDDVTMVRWEVTGAPGNRS